MTVVCIENRPDGVCAEGMIEGAVKRRQSVTSDWQFVDQDYLDGVKLKEIRNLSTSYGHLTEIYRRDWGLDGGGADQAFMGALGPGQITAWHVHGHTTDRLFGASGQLKVVLYDAREGSPTHGKLNEFRIGPPRPALVVVPPGVWHGVQNVADGTSILINVVDRAYSYDDPDHWSLPADTPKIPYSF